MPTTLIEALPGFLREKSPLFPEIIPRISTKLHKTKLETLGNSEKTPDTQRNPKCRTTFKNSARHTKKLLFYINCFKLTILKTNTPLKLLFKPYCLRLGDALL